MQTLNAFLASAALSVASVACASTATPAPTAPHARAVLTSQFGPGAEAGVNDAAKCQVAMQDWATIGDSAHPVDDGQSASGSTVSVSCIIKPDGDGFAVDASVSLAGQGAIVLRGHFTPAGKQTNVYAAFTRGLVGNFQQNDCTADYTAGAPMGVVAGRLWATLTCPHLFAAQNARTCLGTAEIRLENCVEK
jgi:hypothetical protein